MKKDEIYSPWIHIYVVRYHVAMANFERQVIIGLYQLEERQVA